MPPLLPRPPGVSLTGKLELPEEAIVDANAAVAPAVAAGTRAACCGVTRILGQHDVRSLNRTFWLMEVKVATMTSG